MDNDRGFQIEALRELRHIKWLSAATFAILLISGTALVAGIVVLGFTAETLVEDTSFQQTALELFEKGKFQELRSAASERLKEHPNDVYAILYVGKLHLQAREWGEALNAFERIQGLDPASSDYLKPHIEQARQGSKEAAG